MATTDELVLPDLDVGEIPIFASNWLVDLGAPVEVGDRLLEVLADGLTIDLSSPRTGVLAEILTEEDMPLKVGQVLARIIDADPR